MGWRLLILTFLLLGASPAPARLQVPVADDIGVYFRQDFTQCDNGPTLPYQRAAGCENKHIAWENWRPVLENFNAKCKDVLIDREGLPPVRQPCFVGLGFQGWEDLTPQAVYDSLGLPGPHVIQCKDKTFELPHYEDDRWWAELNKARREFALAADSLPNIDGVIVPTGMDGEFTPVKFGYEECVPAEVMDGWYRHMNPTTLVGPEGELTQVYRGVRKPVYLSLRWNRNRFADAIATNPEIDGVFTAGMAGNEPTRCLYGDAAKLKPDDQQNGLPVAEAPGTVLYGGTQYIALRLREAGKALVDEYGNSENGSVQVNLDGWLWGATVLRWGAQGNVRGNYVMADPYWGSFVRMHIGRDATNAPSVWTRIRQVEKPDEPAWSDACRYQNDDYYLVQTNRPTNRWHFFDRSQQDIAVKPADLASVSHDLRNSVSGVNTTFTFEVDEAFARAHPGGAGWKVVLHALGTGASIELTWAGGSTTASVPADSRWHMIEVSLPGAFAYNPSGPDLTVASGAADAPLTLYLVQLAPP
ncbi:MAG TPA: hypothetical protein DEP84_13225, partial [Chloroflexi bacterium]|nr:hypothetical protein [Chloroflexota bacterium]